MRYRRLSCGTVWHMPPEEGLIRTFNLTCQKHSHTSEPLAIALKSKLREPRRRCLLTTHGQYRVTGSSLTWLRKMTWRWKAFGRVGSRIVYDRGRVHLCNKACIKWRLELQIGVVESIFSAYTASRKSASLHAHMYFASVAKLAERKVPSNVAYGPV